MMLVWPVLDWPDVKDREDDTIQPIPAIPLPCETGYRPRCGGMGSRFYGPASWGRAVPRVVTMALAVPVGPHGGGL